MPHNNKGIRNPFFGKHHTEESKEKNRVAHMGNVAWNKGKKGSMIHTDEHKKELSITMKGNGNPFFGRHHTEETKEKIRITQIGRKVTEKQLEGLKLGRGYFKGKRHTQEAKEKNKLAHLGKRTGELNNRWKGGVTPLNHKIRTSSEYKEWRTSVFKRDDYRCFGCGAKNGEQGRSIKLEAHHKYPFAEYPCLRFQLENGITLCSNCHSIEDKYRGTPVSTPVQISFTKE